MGSTGSQDFYTDIAEEFSKTDPADRVDVDHTASVNNDVEKAEKSAIDNMDLNPYLNMIPHSLKPYFNSMQPFVRIILNWIEKSESSFPDSPNLDNQNSSSLPTPFHNLARTLQSKLLGFLNLNTAPRSNEHNDLIQNGTEFLRDILNDANSDECITDSEENSNKNLQRENRKLRDQVNRHQLLLEELKHRLKNHLQVLISHMNLKLRNEQSPEQVMKETQNLLRNLKRFYQTIDLDLSPEEDELNLDKYFNDLICSLVKSLNVDPDRVSTEFQIESDQFPTNSILPVSLILNELVTNAFEHGRGDQGLPNVTITIRMLADKLVMTVFDDGPGMKSDLDSVRSKNGLNIVSKLAEDQLGGELKKENGKNGTTFTLSFPTN